MIIELCLKRQRSLSSITYGIRYQLADKPSVATLSLLLCKSAERLKEISLPRLFRLFEQIRPKTEKIGVGGRCRSLHFFYSEKFYRKKFKWTSPHKNQVSVPIKQKEISVAPKFDSKGFFDELHLESFHWEWKTGVDVIKYEIVSEFKTGDNVLTSRRPSF